MLINIRNLFILLIDTRILLIFLFYPFFGKTESETSILRIHMNYNFSNEVLHLYIYEVLYCEFI